MFTLSDFNQAQERIRPHLKPTSMTLDASSQLYLKWESHQPTHSFKVRGALNKVFSMESVPPILVTGSAGNHGQAIALAAQISGSQAWVFVPEKTPHIKVEKMLKLGAKVERVPGLFGEAEARAIQVAREQELPFVSAYNDRGIIAGAGTIALEMLEQVPHLSRILVPAGGGGLISGVGLAAKLIHPEIEIVGVLSQASPFLYHQFYYGHMTDVVERPTLTDGLAGAVEAGSITLELISQSCDSIIQVTEADVADAVAYLHQKLGEVVEGSGAVGMAAVLSGKIDTNDLSTGTIISGGNIDPDVLEAILELHPGVKGPHK